MGTTTSSVPTLCLKMSYFQSPLHFHILCLRNFSELFQTYLRNSGSRYLTYHGNSNALETFLGCDICLQDLDGSPSVYCCEKCTFYVHTSCATSLRQIQHPRHDHPLDLRANYGEYPAFSYRCVEFDLGCTFALESDFALATLWAEKYYGSILQEAGDGESPPQLPHEHPLTAFPARSRIFCGGCRMQISEEEAYGCGECNFFLHEACAMAPVEIQHHPFHPEHRLSLFCDSSNRLDCQACQLVSYSTKNRKKKLASFIGYRCEKCQMILDLSCAIGTMLCDADEREKTRGRSPVMHHYLHPHQLSSYHTRTQTNIKCKICDDRISSGDFFACPDCRFFLHESCAQPPAEIEHYLHPEHTLAFARFPHEEEHRCQCCSSPVNDDFYSYACQMCDFYVDQKCALQTLSYLEEGVSTTVQHSLHEHELKLRNRSVYYEKCTACEGTIQKSPVYRCDSQECYFQLHRSCAHLPSELAHPSLSRHPLTLSYVPRYEGDTDCRRCCVEIRGFIAFWCGDCSFYLHVDCAQMPTLKHPFHEHCLFYFWKMDGLGDAKLDDMECSACRKSCDADFFRCAQCNFNVHYHCSRLQPTINSEHHFDPLVLRESIIEDESGEYYCDICELRRDPKKWVYFCETCDYNFVAHVECALSSVKLEVIEEDNFIKRAEDIERRQEGIKLVQGKVDATEATLRPLVAKLESLRAKLEELNAEQAKWLL